MVVFQTSDTFSQVSLEICRPLGNTCKCANFKLFKKSGGFDVISHTVLLTDSQLSWLCGYHCPSSAQVDIAVLGGIQGCQRGFPAALVEYALGSLMLSFVPWLLL